MSNSLNYLQGITIKFKKIHCYNSYRIPFVDYIYTEEVSANCIATKLVAHRIRDCYISLLGNLQLPYL